VLRFDLEGGPKGSLKETTKDFTLTVGGA
jgi:hypothetical protein